MALKTRFEEVLRHLDAGDRAVVEETVAQAHAKAYKDAIKKHNYEWFAEWSFWLCALAAVAILSWSFGGGCKAIVIAKNRELSACERACLPMGARGKLSDAGPEYSSCECALTPDIWIKESERDKPEETPSPRVFRVIEEEK